MKPQIKPEELRIGNWVNYKGVDVQWSIEDFEECEKGNILLYLRPIPLSEEWLKKFGFSNVESISKGWYKKGINVSGRLRYMHIITEYGTPVVNNLDYQADIKYVHQLQNLYFALTGEELTINEQG